jgi:acyltransferase
MRLKNIDFTKGILILLVIIGHFLKGSLSESIPRFIIYNFHMPLFIGISGFLFSTAHLKQISFGKILSKYVFRIIVPWIIAVVTYIFIVNGNVFKLDNQNFILIYSFITPYFHLWFIPGFLSWVLLTWSLKKFSLSDRSLLIFGIIISTLFYILKENPDWFINIRYLGRVLEIILYTFRPYFFVFFVVGNYLKSNPIQMNLKTPIIYNLIGVLTLVTLFYFPHPFLYGILFFIFNFYILTILIQYSVEDRLPHSKVIEWLGINSLGIYLWHVVPILLIEHFFEKETTQILYFYTVISEVIYIYILMNMSKIKFINKYILGM